MRFLAILFILNRKPERHWYSHTIVLVLLLVGCPLSLPGGAVLGEASSKEPRPAEAGKNQHETEAMLVPETERTRGIIRNTDDPLIEATPELMHAHRTYTQRVAVVIGINAYQGKIRPLHGAVEDAQNVAETLQNMGFDDVQMLVDEQAKKRDILDILRQELPSKIGPNDLIVVFFAGHGVFENGTAYLLPQDATLNATRSGLSMRTLKETALGLRVRGVLFLVDACFSGSMLERDRERQGRVRDVYWEEARSGRVVQILTAGRASEASPETNETGVFSDAIVRGFGMGEADISPRDLVVTLDELGHYARNTVVRRTSGRQHPQWGTIEGNGTVVMFDLDHVPQDSRRRLPAEIVAGIEKELEMVRTLVARRMWMKAEESLRALTLSDPDPELNILLAEVYLEMGGTMNRKLIERELEQAEKGSLTNNQKTRVFEARKETNRLRKSSF